MMTSKTLLSSRHLLVGDMDEEFPDFKAQMNSRNAIRIGAARAAAASGSGGVAQPAADLEQGVVALFVVIVISV